jgi:hypothetical protein
LTLDHLVPIQKWPICPISALPEKFYPRNINHMSLVKFFGRLDLRPNFPISGRTLFISRSDAFLFIANPHGSRSWPPFFIPDTDQQINFAREVSMENNPTAIDLTDNGGRRRIRDRRFLVSGPFENDRRTNWDRRSGYDRRLRRVLGGTIERRLKENRPADSV